MDLLVSVILYVHFLCRSNVANVSAGLRVIWYIRPLLTFIKPLPGMTRMIFANQRKGFYTFGRFALRAKTTAAYFNIHVTINIFFLSVRRLRWF